MPVLENAKHEAFAYGLAKGMKQKKAYVHAGYEANDSAASRLAASPMIKKRVEELKEQEFQAVNRFLDEPNEENARSLKELGLTIEWCAEAYKKIYETALKEGQLAPANSAVSNIQKLIEIQGAGKGDEEKEPESLIKVSEVSGMLGNLAEVLKAAQGPAENKDPAADAVDVTPAEEEVVPSALLEHLGEIDDDDHPAGT